MTNRRNSNPGPPAQRFKPAPHSEVPESIEQGIGPECIKRAARATGAPQPDFRGNVVTLADLFAARDKELV